MKDFLRFYRWGMEVKLYMSIYTLALVFFRGIVAVLQGENSVNVWIMLEMMLVSFVFACAQYVLLPAGRTFERPERRRRTVVWALLGNALCLGGAAVFRWFPGIPAWGTAVLVAMLELGLFAMWFGDQVARRRDTQALNKKLRQFQNEP